MRILDKPRKCFKVNANGKCKGATNRDGHLLTKCTKCSHYFEADEFAD